MKKLFIFPASLLVIAAALFWSAQPIQASNTGSNISPPPGIMQSGSVIAGHIMEWAGNNAAADGSLAAPSVPTCSTNCASINAGSTDARGSFTTASSVTFANILFGTQYVALPVCIFTSNSTPVIEKNALSVNGFGINTSGVGVSGLVVYYICIP